MCNSSEQVECGRRPNSTGEMRRPRSPPLDGRSPRDEDSRPSTSVGIVPLGTTLYPHCTQPDLGPTRGKQRAASAVSARSSSAMVHFYDRNRGSIERNATHAVAAFVGAAA